MPAVLLRLELVAVARRTTGGTQERRGLWQERVGGPEPSGLLQGRNRVGRLTFLEERTAQEPRPLGIELAAMKPIELGTSLGQAALPGARQRAMSLPGGDGLEIGIGRVSDRGRGPRPERRPLQPDRIIRSATGRAGPRHAPPSPAAATDVQRRRPRRSSCVSWPSTARGRPGSPRDRAGRCAAPSEASAGPLATGQQTASEQEIVFRLHAILVPRRDRSPRPTRHALAAPSSVRANATPAVRGVGFQDRARPVFAAAPVFAVIGHSPSVSGLPPYLAVAQTTSPTSPAIDRDDEK